MKRRLFDWLYALLERLLLILDGRAPTKVRIKAVKPVTPAVAVYSTRTQRHISKERERMKHHCDIPPWGTAGGSWYCPLCRTWRVYQPLPLPREEATAPHFVPLVRGRHNGHLLHVSGRLVDTGKWLLVGRQV